MPPFENGLGNLTFLPARIAVAANTPRKTKKIARAILSPSAVTASGLEAFFAARNSEIAALGALAVIKGLL
jgi:hypothetical protein